MIKTAPETPSTIELQRRHVLPAQARAATRAGRAATSEVLRTGQGFFAGIGACALTDNPLLLRQEGASLKAMEAMLPGLVTGQRLNDWKPRTKADAWFGMNTTKHETERAFQIVTAQAATFGNAIMELGYPGHVARYAEDGRILLGWIGARADGSKDPNGARDLLETAAAVHDLPLGIKNGLDGDVRAAVQRARLAESMRGDSGAPAVVIYRGGENALTPEAWEAEYKLLWELTDGRFIADTAHGSSMAHDAANKKTTPGQMSTLGHVTRLALEGYAPAGILMEASNTPSVVDTNMPHDMALMGMANLASIKLDLTPIHV